MNSWWETPSNSDFLRHIVDESWFGNIVLVYTPEHTPAGLISALRREFNKRDVKNIERLNLKNCNSQNLFEVENIIYDHFALSSENNYVAKNIKDIFENLKKHEIGALFFENIPSQFKIQFGTFIDALRRYLLNINTFEKPKIICFIDPRNILYNDIPGEVGIVKILYQKVFDKLDNLFGLKYFLDKKDTKCFELNNLVTSYISVFDYTLIEELSELPNFFFGDISFLDNYIEKEEWEKFSFKPIERLTDAEVWERWANGILEKKNDQIIYHAAFLKAKGKVEEIYKRIWNAELEIIIPLIENIRFLLIENRKIVFPDNFINKKTGLTKSDKHEFEIGEISYLMDSYKIKFIHFSSLEKKEIKDFVSACKSIRNDLSHIRNLNKDDLELFFKNYNGTSALLIN